MELVAAGAVELFVRRFGDPALPMLVVVHGGPTWDHSYLLPAVAALADLAHVVLFDLRGCGRSSRTPPSVLPVAALQPDLAADDVAALIRYSGAVQRTCSASPTAAVSPCASRISIQTWFAA